MTRENYYILLELQLEPPEHDKDRIKRAIEAKQVEWSNIRLNALSSKKVQKAEEYLEMIPDIRDIMADDDKRRQEIREAVEITRQIDEKLELFTMDRSITEEEIDEISRELSVNKEFIRKRIKEFIDKTKVVEKLEPSTYKNITDNLQTIGKKSLYDFLGASAADEIDELKKKIEEKDADIKSNSKRDHKRSASQVLIGHCRKLFKTEEMKRRYDATRESGSLEKLDQSINGMSRVLPLLKEAKQARENGDLEKAAALFNRVLYFWPNHTEALTLLQEIEAAETKMTQLTRQINAWNPLKIPGISKVIMGTAGIALAFISLVSLIEIIVNLIKDKTYIGSEPYLAASVLTLIICTAISGWGIRNLLTGYKDIKGSRIRVFRQFEVYSQVETELTQNHESSNRTAVEHFLKKDKIFLIGYFVFMGLVILFFIGKALLPDEFFWNLRLTPKYFSFPLDITIPLTAAAVLRWVSRCNHQREKNRETGKTDGPAPTLITCKADPDTFAPGIKEKLTLLQPDGKTNLAYYTGLSPSRGNMSKNGKIQGKLFIETHPEPVPHVRPVFINLYLLLAVILTGIGIFYMTRIPPDNISVLTVPAIAMGYIWSIIKGGILIYSGTSLLTVVTRLNRVRRYQSVMVYVEITGEKDRNAYEFNVFTAALWTEMKTANGERQIIKMTAGQESEKAKKLVTDAIESFV